MNRETISENELEGLRSRLSRESNNVEAAKLQKELYEKEALYHEQFVNRLKEIENAGTGMVGSS
jgi:hypothetical protein